MTLQPEDKPQEEIGVQDPELVVCVMWVFLGWVYLLFVGAVLLFVAGVSGAGVAICGPCSWLAHVVCVRFVHLWGGCHL